MKLRFSELFLLFLFGLFITITICGFEPHIFLGWIDEKDTFLSWAVSHDYGSAYNSQFAGGTIFSEGMYRTPKLLYGILEIDSNIRNILLNIIRLFWILIVLSEVISSWENIKYRKIVLVVTSLLLFCDYTLWGYFYGGMGIRLCILSCFLIINNENNYKRNIDIFLSFLKLIFLLFLGYISLTSIEYAAIFSLELIIINLINKIYLKKLHIDKQLILSTIFCLGFFCYILFSSINSNDIYARDIIFDFRQYFIPVSLNIKTQLWRSFYLRTTLGILVINFVIKRLTNINFRIKNFYILFISLLPTLITISIYAFQEIVFRLNIDSRILLYRSSFHNLQDGIILSISFIGILPFNKHINSERGLNKSHNQNNIKIRFYEIFLFFIVLFPLSYSLIQRSLSENFVLKTSDKKVKAVADKTLCRRIAYNYDSGARLFSIYDKKFSSFFGWKPYNSLRRYLFIQHLVNNKYSFKYHHLQMYGKTENYDIDWLKLTGICALVNENNEVFEIDSHKSRSVENYQIIFSKNPQETLKIMKIKKNSIINQEVVVAEKFIKKSLKNKKNSKYKTSISEVINPSTKIAIFQNEHRQNFYGVCFYEKEKFNQVEAYSANLINTLVICKSKPKKIILFSEIE